MAGLVGLAVAGVPRHDEPGHGFHHLWCCDVTPENVGGIIDQHLGQSTTSCSTADRAAMPSDVTDAPAVHRFSDAERDSFHRLVAARRDMRHFSRGARVDGAVLARVLRAAHHAPSVGLMQPWRFIRITDSTVRQHIAALVETERQATAAALDERGDAFLRLKVEGVRDCAELLVAALEPDDGTVFGRRTMPQEMAICSLACAVQNLWLAARADNLGLGWVSMFDPAALARLLHMPEGARPLAVLCLGPVEQFYDAPMLEREGWRHGHGLDHVVFENAWDGP